MGQLLFFLIPESLLFDFVIRGDLCICFTEIGEGYMHLEQPSKASSRSITDHLRAHLRGEAWIWYQLLSKSVMTSAGSVY